MHTARAGLLGKVAAWSGWIYLGIYAILTYFTCFFARPALTGRSASVMQVIASGITSAERPEWNPMIRCFTSGVEVNPPADLARIEFNLYLRFITTPLIFMITLFTFGMAADGIVSERTRETWDSLIATSLTARDILRGNMLAGLWRMRVILTTLLVLWTIGLIVGSVHPAGYFFSLLVVAAWTWLMPGASGISVSITLGRRTRRRANLSLHGAPFDLLATGTLRFFFPSFLPRMFKFPGPSEQQLAPFVAMLDVACVLPRRPQRLPILGLPGLAMDAHRHSRGAYLGCRYLPDLHHHPRRVRGFLPGNDALANFDHLIGRPKRTEADIPMSAIGR